MPKVVLGVFGSYSVLVGALMMTAPGVFYETLGTFGARNDRYIFDSGTFEFPLGLLMLTAIRIPSWRVPTLAFATTHWGLHAISHLIDPHHGAGDWVGWLEAAGLVVSTVLMAIALRAGMTDQKTEVR